MIMKMNKKGNATLYIIIFIILAIIFVGYAWWNNNEKTLKSLANPSTIQPITVKNTTNTTKIIKITSKTFPNPTLTPGDILTMDYVFVCNKGYASQVRAVSEATKKQVYKEYNIAYPPAKNTYVIDHYISLELGGSNDIKNLWPQPYADSLKKDKVENYLQRLMCNRTINISEAQSEIKNWTVVYPVCCAK